MRRKYSKSQKLGKGNATGLKRINDGVWVSVFRDLEFGWKPALQIVIPSRGRDLAFIYLPVSIGLVAEFEQPVFGIVTLPAIGTDQIAAPTGAAPVIVRRNGETQTATARHQAHF